MVYFIADLHLCHTNVLKLSHRPFETLEQMECAMIARWLDKVQEEDIVYILGDVTYKSNDMGRIIRLLQSLPGHKHLIIGNHDRKMLKSAEFRECFESISDMATLYLNNNTVQVILCHYPILEWDGYFRGAYHVHGHIHNNIHTKSYQYLLSEERALNAGVDITGFAPVTLEELIVCNHNFKEYAKQQIRKTKE